MLPPRSAAALALRAQAQPAHWFSQQLDHFDANDTRSFDQRYYLDETHFRAPFDGPVFLYVSGEAPLYGAPAAVKVAVLAWPHQATTGSSGCTLGLEAALHTPQKRPSASDRTERPWHRRQAAPKSHISLRSTLTVV